MSWLTAARNVLARWGAPARFAVRHVVAAAFPGGSLAADLLDDLLECVHKAAKDQEELESHARTLASEEELLQVGEVLDEVNGRLSNLMEQVTHMEGLPDAADRLIRVALATDEAVRAGFANLSGIVGRFDRIEAQGREILQAIGYGNDLQETTLTLLNRLNIVVEYVEELRASGVQPRLLGDLLATFSDCLAQARAGRAAEALPRLRAIEAERPASAAVQVALAASASLTNDLLGADRALKKAAKQRPTDIKLAALGRPITQAASGLETPVEVKGGGKGPNLGEVLDGWKLTRILGQGGWGQVFRAERDGHVRALKVLRPELSAEPGFEDNFKREILTLHSLGRQSHLVEFDTFGYARPEGYLYFLMEFIEGESLQTRLQRQGPLSVPQALELFLCLAGEGGLATAHSKGIVHRDIKPANILLRTKNGSPVLVDFGLALAGARGISSINRITGYTAMFAAPEQLRGRPADTRSDVYSLAGTLFYALSLQEPEDFDASRLPTELASLGDVFVKALDRRRDARPKDAAALAVLLAQVPRPEAADRPKQSPVIEPTDLHRILERQMADCKTTGNLIEAARTIAKILAASPNDNSALQARLQLARPLIELATEAAGKIDHPTWGSQLRTQAYLSIAKFQAELGDASGAEASLESAFGACQTLKDADERLRTLEKIAALQNQLGARDAAQASFDAARATLDAMIACYEYKCRDVGTTYDYRNFGEAKARLGDKSGAKAWFEVAKAIVPTMQATKYQSAEANQGSELSYIAESQAKAGDIAGAKTTASDIKDKDWKDIALENITKVQANAGDFSGALATARTIANDYRQACALQGVALCQAKFGDVAGSIATIGEVRDEGQLLSFVTDLSGEGANPAIESILDNLIKGRISSHPSKEDDFVLFELYLRLSSNRIRLKDFSGAKASFDRALSLFGFQQRPVANLTIARLYAELGEPNLSKREIQVARENADGIADTSANSLKWVTYEEIAVTQARLGDIAGARATAAVILEDSSKYYSGKGHLSRKWSAFEAIVIAQIRAGDIPGAKATADTMAPAPQKATAYRAIAAQQILSGDQISFKSWLPEEFTVAFHVPIYVTAVKLLISPDADMASVLQEL